MIDVLLVDDYQLVRIGVRCTLEEHEEADGIRVVGEASCGEEALQLVRALRPRVVLLDLVMPGIGGIATMQRILKVAPKTRIIILAAVTEGPLPRRLLGDGAVGYLTKGCAPEEMVEAIKVVDGGGRYLSREVAQNIALTIVDGPDTSPIDRLSKRELSVLTLFARGYRPDDIATMLSISPKTVSTYKTRMQGKLGTGGMGGLLQLAFSLGLAEDRTS